MKTARVVPAAVVVGVLLAAALGAAPSGSPGADALRIASAAAPVRTADPAVADPPDTDVPLPPPLRAVAPDGEPPDAAPGLRAAYQCVPPASGPGGAAGPTPTERLRLEEVHRLATGRGQLVAVIDTGVAPNPFLGARLRGGGDYLTGGDGRQDCDGHGTAVAGIVAAAPGGDGLVGMAPDAAILAIRQSSPSFTVPGADGTPQPAGDVDSLAESIVLAVRAGADVVNISEAVCLTPTVAASAGARVQAALRYAAEADIVVVTAAGNVGVGGCLEASPAQVSLPGWYDDLVTVGAVDAVDAPAAFTVPGPWVDIAAPGSDLRSLAVDGGWAAEPVSGTSFSAPWVAGLAALLRERFPQLTATEVVQRIVATARRPAGGHDDLLGSGVIDPLAALSAEPLLPPADGGPDPAPATLAAPAPPPPRPDLPLDVAAVALLVVAAIVAGALVRSRPSAR